MYYSLGGRGMGPLEGKKQMIFSGERKSVQRLIAEATMEVALWLRHVKATDHGSAWVFNLFLNIWLIKCKAMRLYPIRAV